MADPIGMSALDFGNSIGPGASGNYSALGMSSELSKPYPDSYNPSAWQDPRNMGGVGGLNMLSSSFRPPVNYNPMHTANIPVLNPPTPSSWQQSTSNGTAATSGAQGAWGSGAVLPNSYAEHMDMNTFKPTTYDPGSWQYPYDPDHPFAASISDQPDTGDGVLGNFGNESPVQHGFNQFYHPLTPTPWAGNNPTNSNNATSGLGVGGLTQMQTK